METCHATALILAILEQGREAMHLLILGCGDIGTRVGLSLIQQGWRVSAVRRQPHLLPDCFERLGLDITDEERLADLARLAPDYARHPHSAYLRPCGVSGRFC